MQFVLSATLSRLLLLQLGFERFQYISLSQWFPTGEEFLPGEEFHEFRGGISTL